MLEPFQRGTADNINTPGAPDCDLWRGGMCGGRPAEQPKVVLEPGSNYTVVFQKNLDHYNSTGTGEFRIIYETLGHTGSFRILKRITDTPTPSLYLYTEEITLPRLEVQHAVIGVQYVVPWFDATFYQCADISLRRR